MQEKFYAKQINKINMCEKMFLPQTWKNIIIFPLDFLYWCAILSQTMVWHAVHQTGVVFSLQGHSSTVEYRSPKPRMRVRFLLPLPQIVANIIKWMCFMNKILEYVKSVRREWFKIVWPSRDTVVRATIMILVFSAIAALFFFAVDSLLGAIVNWIF